MYVGMQVSARYLLERCSVVAWLQQMASPTNSLDINTTQSIGSEKISTADSVPMDEGEEELEGEEVAKDLKGKDRGVVVRSKASVLLAAPPRLLARVLCLLRRALGATYLLSADSSSSSSHLQQIKLAIITLSDVSCTVFALVSWF
jgi:hypothetical protein